MSSFWNFLLLSLSILCHYAILLLMVAHQLSYKSKSFNLACMVHYKQMLKALPALGSLSCSLSSWQGTSQPCSELLWGLPQECPPLPPHNFLPVLRAWRYPSMRLYFTYLRDCSQQLLEEQILNSAKFNLSEDTQIGSDGAWSGSYH